MVVYVSGGVLCVRERDSERARALCRFETSGSRGSTSLQHYEYTQDGYYRQLHVRVLSPPYFARGIAGEDTLRTDR